MIFGCRVSLSNIFSHERIDEISVFSMGSEKASMFFKLSAEFHKLTVIEERLMTQAQLSRRAVG